jgi:exosome complex exonuclease RRP6
MDSFKTLQDSISCALVSTTRAATRLSAADIPFQRSLDPEVATALDEQNARLLQLAQHLLETAASSSDAVGPKLPDIDAIDGNWRGIVDVVDSLLEKADTSLDEYTGVVKRLAQTGDQVRQSWFCLTAPRPYFHLVIPSYKGPFRCPPENVSEAPVVVRTCTEE